MSDIKEITDRIVEFRDERDWAQFHNPKDLAIALSIESNELLEAFLWKSPQEARKEKIEEELADVFMFAFLLANEQGINVKEIIQRKLEKNGEKYPVSKSKGSAKKYDEL